jgi:hypothetical protein
MNGVAKERARPEMQNATRGAVEVAASHSFAAASPEARRRRAHMNNCARY